MWEIVIGMSVVVLRSSNFEIELGVGCLIELSLKSSPNDAMLPFVQKRGHIPTRKPARKS